MRSATFEAVRVYLGVRAFQEADEERLRAHLMEKCHTHRQLRGTFSSRDGLAG